MPFRHHDREILRLAVPAFGALIAEPLFLLADTAIVGRLGIRPLGALGVAGQALTTVVNLCVFLAYGTTAAVARQVGAGHTRSAVRQGVDGLWLALAIGAVIIVAGWPLVPGIVHVFGASPAITPYAVTYLRISLLGVPGMLVVLAGTGVLRGLQDAATPLVVAVAMFVANGVLNGVFVLALGWGIAGSAWGTVIAQTCGAAAYLVVVARGARRYGAPLRPDLAGVRAAATAGVALLVRTATMRVVLVVSTAIAARMGDVEIAAHQVATQVWSLLSFAMDAIAIAGQAITGRYLGASDVTGARAATRRMVGWGIGSGVVFAVAVIVARPFLPGLFTGDPRVRALLMSVLWVVAAAQPVSGLVYVLDGVLIGAGDQRYLAVAGVITMVAYLGAAYAVHAAHAGLVALWLAFCVWMLARAITLGVRAYGDAWLVTGAVRR
jgi:putative MATE family efflux protein